MKKLAIGILAHVDAGKTTLCEALLYLSGAIRKRGRVDRGDAYLDTHTLEKARGITIFSKQAKFNYNNTIHNFEAHRVYLLCGDLRHLIPSAALTRRC